MLIYKIEGKDIFKNPPQDFNTKFNGYEFKKELEMLMRKYNIHDLTAKVRGEDFNPPPNSQSAMPSGDAKC